MKKNKNFLDVKINDLEATLGITSFIVGLYSIGRLPKIFFPLCFMSFLGFILLGMLVTLENNRREEEE